jgi:hypothetical protein
VTLLTLDDAIETLGNVTAGRESLLQMYVDAVTPVLEDIVGPIDIKTFTETIPGRADSSGRAVLTLSRTPVVTVTSIVAQRQGMYEPDLTNLVIDSETGVLLMGNWFSWFGPITVTYTAGRANPPANLKLAALELLRFWWQVGQQGNRPGFGDAADSTEWAGASYAVPRRVMELCAPNRKPPGIA